jgi:hypothetical protein
MRPYRRFLFLLLALQFLSVGSAMANRIDVGASGKGEVNPPLPGTCTLANVASGLTNVCVAFQITTPSTASWANIIPVFDSSFNVIGSTEFGPLALVLVPTTSPFTLQLPSATADYGSFLCDPSTDPTMSTQLSGFCTDIPNSPGDDLSGFLSSGPVSPGNQVTFDFVSGAPGLPADWVFYTREVATPEPSTLLLLSSGLAVLLGKRRRAQV